MRDNPGSTEEEALDYLNSLNGELFKELNLEYLKPGNIPTCSKDHAMSLSRGFHFFYIERDGFTISTKDTRDHILNILVQPIAM